MVMTNEFTLNLYFTGQRNTLRNVWTFATILALSTPFSTFISCLALIGGKGLLHLLLMMMIIINILSISAIMIVEEIIIYLASFVQ